MTTKNQKPTHPILIDPKAFAQYTTLKSSTAWNKAGLSLRTSIDYNHAKLWRDDDGGFIVTTEPYCDTLPRQIRSLHGHWIRVRSHVMYPGPDPTLFILSTPRYGASIFAIANRLANAKDIVFDLEGHQEQL